MKNYFEINWVTKNLQWDITYVWYFVTYDWWSKFTKYSLNVDLAIVLIESAKCEFRVKWWLLLPNQRVIVVVNKNWKKYLRSVKDWIETNNLDNLSILPETK